VVDSPAGDRAHIKTGIRKRWKKIVKSEWRVLTDRNACTTELRVRFAGRKYRATGSAKREKGDVFNPRIGRTLATARALNDLAIQMEADAMAEVTASEADKQARAEARAERRPGKSKPLLTITEIREKYGAGAADRAAARRKQASIK
jgi:hypothetical protein